MKLKANSVNVSHPKYSGPKTSHQSNMVPIENQDQYIVAKCKELRSESCAMCNVLYFELIKELFSLGTIHLRRRHVLGGGRGQNCARFADGQHVWTVQCVSQFYIPQ